MAGTDETSNPASLLRPCWLAPIATRRFSAVGDVIYALTTTIAFVLSFGAGAIWGQMMGYLGVFIFAPVIWLVGAAIKYKLGGGPFGSSW